MGPAEQALRTQCASKNLRYVGLRGNPNSPVWFVGEAPGADEEASGLPFVGSSGKELDRMGSEAGFNMNEVCFTNPYKVRPPNNVLEKLEDLGIPEQCYLDQFREELETYKPRIIIACGATPLSVLCPHTRSKRDGISKITQWRGSLLSCSWLPESYVVPVLHPSAILREWNERQIAILCIGRAFEEASFLKQHGKLNPLPERELITEPPASLVLEFLHDAIRQTEPVSNDMETIGGKYPYTFSVATSPKRAISFSFWNYDDTLLVQIWRLFDRMLRTQRTIGQNYLGFDCHELNSLGFAPAVEKVDDTLIRHHTLWPEFEHKLQFQTFQYTREPYYKDEGKLWYPKEGLHRLMLYNCKDTAVTYEVFLAQEDEFNDRPWLRTFYTETAIKRARAYYRMDDRGLLVDVVRLRRLRDDVLRRIDKEVQEAEQITGKPTAAASCLAPEHKNQCKCNIKAVATAHGVKQNAVFNMASPKQLTAVLQERGIKIPTKRASKGKPSRLSVDETALRKIILANTQEKLPQVILNARELLKAKGTYIDAPLLDNVLYTSFSPTGTITFRCSSRRNIFYYGTNTTNLPKHSKLGEDFRFCIVARPGKMFVAVDQKGAEDWIVQGWIVDHGGSRRGLDELLQGINRHKRLAAFLFAKPENEIDKKGMEYYLGKRTRHAGNYGMRENTMADNLLKDGFPIPVNYCAWLLKRFHEAEPDIRGVFHKSIEDLVSSTRTLRNPLGFERIFFGLRPYASNEDVFREAYAQIPQSTVACNNGMAIVYMDERNAPLLKDDHDATTLEIDDNDEALLDAARLMKAAYNRVIRFPNGLELTIPIEFEFGYNLRDMEGSKDVEEETLLATIQKVREGRKQCQENSVEAGSTPTLS